MLPLEIRQAIQSKYAAGALLSDLADEYGVGKSTIHYIVREVKRSVAGTTRATAGHALTSARNTAALRSWRKENPDAATQAAVRGGYTTQRLHGTVVIRNFVGGGLISGLTYREDELGVKTKLEQLYGCTFRKEAVANRYFDFCSSDYVIEHTIDRTTGRYAAFSRLEQLVALGDKRKLIAYVIPFTKKSKRLEEICSLGIEVLDVRSL